MERLGRYHLAGEVSSGDFVTVHRAYLVTGGGVARPVAVKRILTGLARDQEAINLLVEEARITAQLEHASILGLVDLDQVDGVWMLATERVLGRPLSVVVAKAKERGVAIDPQAAAYVTIQILSALAHAHERTDARGDLLGIVHRDVCPSNVLLAYSGEVKLSSFAYAKIRGRAGGTHPRIEPRYAYMSPEQALGSDVDHRADVFGAGLILYELLAGRPAYETRSVHETLLAAQRGRMAPIAEVARNIPPELAAVVDKALAFDRRGRHASAAVFRDELARVLYQRDPTYGTHRLMSLMARVLGDEAFDDRLTEATERAELEAEVGAPAAGRAGSVRRAPPVAAAVPSTPAPAVSRPASAAGSPAAAMAAGLAATQPSMNPPPGAAADLALESARRPVSTVDDRAPPRGVSAANELRSAASSPPPELDTSAPRVGRTITDTSFDPSLERGGAQRPAAPPPPPPPSEPGVRAMPLSRIVSGAPQPAAVDPLAIALGSLAPSAPAAPPIVPKVSSFAAAATTVMPSPSDGAAPLPFEKKRLPLGKIALGLVAIAAVGLAAFAFSSPANYRLVTRKLRTAIVGRHPGGVLLVESLPPGARLWIDGDDSGRKTPVTVENLESEVVHDLRLELEGEEAVSSTVAIRAGEKRTVTLMFPDAVVPLSVITNPPGAELWLDNRSVALTPASLMVRVGKEVNVRLTRVGYVEHVETLVPERRKPINIDFTMEKTQAMLEQEAAEKAALEAAENEEPTSPEGEALKAAEQEQEQEQQAQEPAKDEPKNKKKRRR